MCIFSHGMFTVAVYSLGSPLQYTANYINYSSMWMCTHTFLSWPYYGMVMTEKYLPPLIIKFSFIVEEFTFRLLMKFIAVFDVPLIWKDTIPPNPVVSFFANSCCACEGRPAAKHPYIKICICHMILSLTSAIRNL